VVNAVAATTTTISGTVATADALSTCGAYAVVNQSDYIDFSVNWDAGAMAWDCVIFYDNPLETGTKPAVFGKAAGMGCGFTYEETAAGYIKQ